MHSESRLNLFQQLAIATVLATLFLIFIGGLVRASGAGLGCPDWPRCWGTWWPPGGVAEIDATRYDVSLFNPVKMWTEYVNRLIGVTIGLFITATFLASFRYRKSRPVIFWGALASLLLVMFEGWLGALVVRSGLHQGMITAHMFVAVVLVSLLLYITFLAHEDRWQEEVSPKLQQRLMKVAILLYLASMVQVVFGSQVRETLGEIHRAFPEMPRTEWIEEAGWIDHIHRSFSWLILFCGLYLTLQIRKEPGASKLRQVVYVTAALIVFQIALGIGLVYGGIPWILQLLHTGSSAVLICAESLVILLLRSAKPHPEVTSQVEWSPAVRLP